MKLLRTINPPLWRVVVLLCLFLLISSAAGPRVISGGIVFRDGFALYGGIGKALIFGLIAFVLLTWRTRTPLTLRPWRPVLLWWLAASSLAFAASWTSISRLLAGERQVYNLVLAHAGLILSVVFAVIACIGLKNIHAIWRKYSRELLGAAALAVTFYGFLLLVYRLWQPLASAVLLCVTSLLGASGLTATFIPPHTLVFDKFSVTIAEYCSGIESIALFTGLYAIVGLLDWERLRKRRYFVVFPFALLVLCGLNVLRVYGLIMAGYYINPEIAFSLFHTYAGLVFFILYSAVFWMIAYKYLLNKPKKENGYE